MALKAVKKITGKDFVSVLRKEDVTDEETGKTVKRVAEQDLGVIRGRAFTFETGSTQLGEYVTFVGRFEGTVLANGDILSSTRVIFPPIAADIAQSTFMDAKKADETAIVDFAFVIGVEPDARAAVGYKWSCKPVNTGSTADDPLAQLREATNKQLAEILGEEAAKMLTSNSSMPQIGHDPDTGEVKEPKKAKSGV